MVFVCVVYHTLHC